MKLSSHILSELIFILIVSAPDEVMPDIILCRLLSGRSENLWLNSGLLSDCFSGDGWELARLGTDIHSPIQSIERWLPPGHKSQLLQRHTAKALQRAISEASKHVCLRGEEREGEKERCGLTVCTNGIVHGQ